MPWKPPPMPKCARCEKSVYPTEQLKCLDKLWHTSCFNCEICHTKLTMKTYRGFDKKPYCKAHYPEQRATQVADTPESMRLKKQTERQSVVTYQKQYNETKGHYVGSSSDKSMESAQRAANLASNVSYKQEAPKMAAPPAQPAAPPAQPAAPPAQPEPVAQPEPEPQQAEPQAPAPAGGDRWVAVFDYDAADSDEVSFKEGDVIINVQTIDEGWAQGTVERTGESGMIPSNYIEKAEGGAEASQPPAQPEPQAEPEPEPQAEPEPEPQPEPEAPAGDKWRALYDYDAADSDEVSFQEGDVIINVQIIDEGWAQVRLHHACFAWNRCLHALSALLP
ncbi:hypothetical protein PTSG_06072 [Salpingoeca rosetta]|uniref:Uncharacterized protein n=1 Tax=Salpingoeca rosetta (strain ATCC 50818 / BSB-021) TaxID=946362 RepID=F2UDL6_SALR5|nr:uncharacterized protein PTSG_06072 [Salpingoeca rosetta]EGD74711.1 hypothetical protein PTSG_06072 [Salpingoeca rosetta]|eukprot:XP_004992968.1 hypothetical protein PTSG_06072 [Salpingoeca rosetta]